MVAVVAFLETVKAVFGTVVFQEILIRDIPMSSILKALKKLENERQQPPVGQTPLSREVFEGISRAEVTSRAHSPLPLIVLALLLAGAGLGVWLMRQPPPAEQHLAETRPPSVISADSKAPLPSFLAPIAVVKAVEAPVVPLSASVAASQSVAPPEEASVPIAEAPTPAVVEPPAQNRFKESVAKSVATTKAPAVVPPKETVSPVIISPVKSVAASVPVVEVNPTNPVITQVPPKSPGRALSTPVTIASRTPGWALPGAEKAVAPELRVSEIHYKPVAQERLAVVNDLPVLEGVDIDGARVDRIFKDRIRFVFNGRYLEVKLTAEP